MDCFLKPDLSFYSARNKREYQLYCARVLKLLGMSMRLLRLGRGFSQESLADYCFVSERSIRRIENGENVGCLTVIMILLYLWEEETLRTLEERLWQGRW